MGNLAPLDTSLIDLMAHLPWRPPSVVREAALLPESIEDYRASQSEQASVLERELDDWIAAGRAKRERFWHGIAGKTASRLPLDHLTGLIESLEQDQVREAKDLVRLRKALRRDQQRLASRSKEAASILRDLDDRLIRAREKELRERLDFALFLRACRAELDPDSRGGETFENPEDLESYLNAAISS